MRRIFWGFCDNRFLMSPLQYVSSPSDVGFELAEIFVIEKRLPETPTRRVARFSITNISANSKPKSERLEM
jgi:hypothetical protein